MPSITKLPLPLDNQVVKLAGNNAVQQVNDKFDLLTNLLEKAIREASELTEELTRNLPDYRDLVYEHTPADYTDTTALGTYEPDISLGTAQAAVPSRPSYDSISKPAPLGNIEIPDINLNETLDLLRINVTVRPFSYTEEPYASHLCNILTQNLISHLVQGGQSFGGAIETDMFNRGKNRIDAEYSTKIEEARDAWGSFGWTIPPGMLNGVILELTQGRLNAYEQLNTEITIESARLALTNYHKALDVSLSLETLFRNFFIAERDRALRAAEAVVKYALDTYTVLNGINESLIKQLAMRVEVYKTQYSVYYERARVNLEIYKADIEAFKTEWEAQKIKMEAFVAEARAYSEIGQLTETHNDNLIKAEKVKADAYYDNEKNKTELAKVKASIADVSERASSADAQFKIQVGQLNINNLNEHLKMQKQILTSLAEIYNSRVNSLASALNISVGLSDSESAGTSLSFQYGQQDRTSAEYSESYTGKIS